MILSPVAKNIGNLHDAIRVLIGEGTKQNGVHDAEERRVSADSQSKREEDKCRDSGRLRENANGEADVLPHGVSIDHRLFSGVSR